MDLQGIAKICALLWYHAFMLLVLSFHDFNGDWLTFGFGAAIASFMFGLTVKLMMKIVCYNMSVCSQYWKKRHPSWKDENHE